MPGCFFRSFILFNILFSTFHVLVQAQPVISAFSPLSGAGGTVVTITGSGFSNNAALNIVRFNGVKATVTNSSASSITCVVPANAGNGLIAVTYAGLTGVSKTPFRTLFNAGTNTLSNTTFSERLSIQADGPSSFNLAADWDGDEKIDHVSLDDKNFKIRVYRNTSQGEEFSFANPLMIIPAVAPGWAKAADMDGDGLLDLVVFNTGVTSVSIYRNTSSPGNISFAGPVTLSTLEGPFDGVIEDLNNDGKMDLVIVNFNASTLTVFSNVSSLGNLSFSAPLSIPVINGPIAITAGDYNGDGRVDLVVGSGRSGQYAILKNNGGFTFEATTFTNGSSLYYYGCSGDFNNDGRIDFAFTRFNPDQTTVFLNVTPSGGGFNFSPTNYSASGSFINYSDLTGDGFPELLIDLSPLGVAALKNNQSGSPLFSTLNLRVSAIAGIAVADFTGDGKPDIMSSINTNLIKLNVNGLNPFYLSGFSPTAGNRKTVVTLSGGDFNGVTDVRFGGVPAASFNILNNSTIEAIPGFAASGAVEVIKASQVVKMDGFNYLRLPFIKSVEPLVGYPGAEIEIRGRYLNEVSQVAFGNFGAKSFEIQDFTDTLIRAIVGDGGTGVVKVVSHVGMDTFPGFTFYPAPRIDSIASTNTPPGAVVTIFGANLSSVNQVLFHETPGTNLTLVDDGKLEIRTPAFGVGGRVKVISPYGSDSIAGFYNGPIVTSVSPFAGVANGRAIINGTGFANTLSGNMVRFGTIQAKLIESNATQLVVEIPAGTPSGFVSVTAFGITGYFHNPFVSSFNGAGMGFDSTAFGIGPMVSLEASNAESKPVVGDINGDRKPDMVYRADNGSIALAANESISGVIKFANPVVFSSRTITNVVAIHDFDNDGLNDLIAEIPGDDDSSKVFRNTGTVLQPAFTEVPHRYVQKATAIADFDGDGRPDILTASFSFNKMQIYRNISGSAGIEFEAPFPVSWDLSFVDMASAADLNGDGLPELIYRAGGTNVVIQRNLSVPGKLAFDLPQMFFSCSGQKILVSDMDKNGMPDLAVLSGGCTNIFVFQNNSLAGGPIMLSQAGNYNVENGISDFGVGDLNGDFNPEIIVLNTDKPRAIVLTNTSSVGSISFTMARTVSLVDPLISFTAYGGLEVSDFDGDGRADLLTRLVNDTRFAVIRNLAGSFGSGVVCPGGSISLQAQGMANSYQWQASLDSINYVNISNDVNYSGTTQAQLTIQQIPASWSGRYVRCLVNGQPNRPYKIRVINYFTGTFDSDWNNPLNWSCGAIPDLHAEVVVTGNVILNSNATIKSLYIQPGASVQVGAGYRLVILE